MPEISPQELTPAPDPKWTEKSWVRNLAIFSVLAAILYAMVYVDVVMRAREAYLEGEKYMSWSEDPKLKAADLTQKFEKGKSSLDAKLGKNKISRDEYDRELETLAFDRDRQMEESSLKYAYVWYQTAYELFSPPESKWVRLSREKARIAREKWKQELRLKNIPFEDYMLD